MDKLIAALIVVLLLLMVVALWLRNKWRTAKAIKAAKGTVPGGGTPAQATITDAWTTSPATVTAGANTTFVLTVTSAQVSVVPVTRREYMISAPAGVTIVSVNGATPSDPAYATTTAAGIITVVINAAPVEQVTPGALVALQTSADQSTAVSATFTIQ